MPRHQLPVRLALPADAGRISDLINAAYLVERFFVDGPRISQHQVREMMGRGSFLMSERDGTIVASVYVEPRASSAYLGLLAVEPDRQGQGLGTAMLDAAEAHCAQLGCGAIEIRVVNLREELPAFYRRRGYVEAGTEPFTDPRATRPCHFVLMSKPLGYR